MYGWDGWWYLVSWQTARMKDISDVRWYAGVVMMNSSHDVDRDKREFNLTGHLTLVILVISCLLVDFVSLHALVGLGRFNHLIIIDWHIC